MGDSRERDLVLAPNEYAFISDQTKGNVITYVGPYKTSMANTDKPVFFNKKTKAFDICDLDGSIQTFCTAPEGWYIILKNPAIDNKPPQIGTSNQLSSLQIGRKVNLPGPNFFALWPGQMAEVLEGHHLRSNEYLLVRVYEEEQARANWDNAVITPQHTQPEGLEEEQQANDSIDANRLSMGQLHVIKGTNVSFYIPPTGIEVLRDKKGNYVRSAVTLERLEYCILLDEDGNKRYIQGPDVVFPRPTERFIEKNGSRKFKAIELDENSGIYVKIIAPYTENGQSYKVGDELFITGREQMIYFPRPEQALIKYGEQEIYQAVAIPPGEGRYVLNRKSGKISLQKGPAMFLADPREEMILRRILSPKQVELWFPGNQEALQYNLQLQELSKQQQARLRKASKKRNKLNLPPMAQQQQALIDMDFSEENEEEGESVYEGIVSNSFSRSRQPQNNNSLVLDSKYEGAVTIDAWTGYAVLVTSKLGDRKVVVGPSTYLLDYDEVLQGIELSTGTPKSDAKLMRTVYLRILNNKVSDLVRVETADFCELDIHLSYRVNFTGDPEKWFNVENYVKFLTDHLRSVLRNAIKQYNLADFYAEGIAELRNIVLGSRPEGEEQDSRRPGRLFTENGMHIYELEVLDIEILDEEIQELLFASKHQDIRSQLELENKRKELLYSQETEEMAQKIAASRSKTKQFALELQEAEEKQAQMLKLASQAARIDLERQELTAQMEMQEKALNIARLQRQDEEEAGLLQLELKKGALEQRLKELEGEVQAVVQKAEAVSPDLIAALQAFGDKALAEKMAESMAPLSIIGGKSIVEVFGNLLAGSPLSYLLDKKGETQDPDLEE